jgi:hypothetical protein
MEKHLVDLDPEIADLMVSRRVMFLYAPLLQPMTPPLLTSNPPIHKCMLTSLIFYRKKRSNDKKSLFF